MKVFFDTSVLIAAILLQHEHHRLSSAAYLKADKKHACCAAHTLAEVYASLTRMPTGQRLGGVQARFSIHQLPDRPTIISPDAPH